MRRRGVDLKRTHQQGSKVGLRGIGLLQEHLAPLRTFSVADLEQSQCRAAF